MAWGLRRICGASLAMGLVLIGGQANAELLATCGASTGKTYFVENGARWTDDQISKGSFTFTRDAKGNGNVLFKDAVGGVVDASADGGEIILARVSPSRRDFVMMVIYFDTGVVESYNIITGTDGVRQALWTTNRPSGSFAPKVAAFTAVCD